MSRAYETVILDVDVLADSELAIQVTDGDVTVWIPKYLLKADDDCLTAETALPGVSGRICISQSVAEDKELV